MNNLQLIENTDQLIPIRLQDQTEITKKLAAIVSHCFNLAGQTYDVLTLETIVKAVSKQIYLDYKSLSLEEIYFALEQGTLGKYEKYYGLNAVSFCRFIQSYNESEQRTKIKEDRISKNLKLLTPMAELTEAEKTEIVRLGCLEKFEIFKDKKYVNDMGNVAFDYLLKEGKIITTPEKAVDYLRAAEKEIKLDAAMELTMVSDVFLKNLYRDKLNNTRENCLAEIKALAKNMALNDWFGELVSIDAELNDLIGTI
jgi:hypothetical protein